MKRHRLSVLIASSSALGLIACDRDHAPVEQVAAPPAEESRLLDRATEAVKGASERVGEAIRDHAEKEARAMIGQVKNLLAEDQTGVARELMDRLSATKDSLSDALRAEIERLEAMFSDA